jgi:hypothetical protein
MAPVPPVTVALAANAFQLPAISSALIVGGAMRIPATSSSRRPITLQLVGEMSIPSQLSA